MKYGLSFLKMEERTWRFWLQALPVEEGTCVHSSVEEPWEQAGKQRPVQ